MGAVGLINSNMKYLIALAFLTVVSAREIELAKKGVKSLVGSDGTEPGDCWEGWYLCSDGSLCCPEGSFCCPDGWYCAVADADCPVVAKKQQLANMAGEKVGNCDGTGNGMECSEGYSCCPDGARCCPTGWSCCYDGIWCADTADNCPIVVRK